MVSIKLDGSGQEMAEMRNDGPLGEGAGSTTLERVDTRRVGAYQSKGSDAMGKKDVSIGPPPKIIILTWTERAYCQHHRK